MPSSSELGASVGRDDASGPRWLERVLRAVPIVGRRRGTLESAYLNWVVRTFPHSADARVDVPLMPYPPELVDRRRTVAPGLPIEGWLSGGAARRLLVLGTVGSGKTMLLEHLCRSVAAGRVERWRIPVYVDLRRQAQRIVDEPDVTLADLLNGRLRSVGRSAPVDVWVEPRLRGGDCIVLVDDIDAVPAHLRIPVWDWLSRTLKDNPDNCFVLTARGFSDPILRDDVLRLWLPELSDSEIQRLMTSRFGVHDAAGRVYEQVWRLIGNFPDLRRQVRNPAFLDGLLRYVALTGRLRPARLAFEVPRLELYAPREKRGRLRQLALDWLIRDIGGATVAEATATVESTTLIRDSVAAGVLELEGEPADWEDSRVRFAWPVLQAKLAADWLAEEYNPVDPIDPAWLDSPRWHDTVVILTDRLESPGRARIVVECLKVGSLQSVCLAADCIDGVDVSAALRADVHTALAAVVNDADAGQRRRIARQWLVELYTRSEEASAGTVVCGPVQAKLYRLFAADEQAQGRLRTPDAPYPDDLEQPVVGVRSDDALAFAAWADTLLDGGRCAVPGVKDFDDNPVLRRLDYEYWLRPDGGVVTLWSGMYFDSPWLDQYGAILQSFDLGRTLRLLSSLLSDAGGAGAEFELAHAIGLSAEHASRLAGAGELSFPVDPLARDATAQLLQALASVQAGIHRMRVSRNGFQHAERNLALSADAVQAHRHVDLAELPAHAERGRCLVRDLPVFSARARVLSEALVQAIGPVLRREHPITESLAHLVRLGALMLAAEAGAVLTNPALGEDFRQLALGVTLLEQRRLRMEPAETIVLVVTDTPGSQPPE
ncbi:MAG: NACHT domain-containing protein [Mycobacteriaceae bacterium]|nr:NACHT domain-containing protein [Mycobacteriaceae bacterium]